MLLKAGLSSTQKSDLVPTHQQRFSRCKAGFLISETSCAFWTMVPQVALATYELDSQIFVLAVTHWVHLSLWYQTRHTPCFQMVGANCMPKRDNSSGRCGLVVAYHPRRGAEEDVKCANCANFSSKFLSHTYSYTYTIWVCVFYQKVSIVCTLVVKPLKNSCFCSANSV